MKNIIEYITVILLILLFVWAASCTTEDETVVCAKSEPIDGVACIELYQPVRAPDGTIYPNSCYAEADGWDNGCLVLEPIYD